MADEQDQNEFFWKVHSYTNEYIRFADTKAELVIGWTLALVGALRSGRTQEVRMEFSRRIENGWL